MSTLALSPAVLKKLVELINTLVPGPTETVVLTTDLNDCYVGVDGSGAAQPVILDVTGSFTLPVGVSLVIEVQKLDPMTGVFSNVPCTVAVSSTGTTTVTVAGADHGVTSGCANFLIYFIAVYPGTTPPKRKILLIKAFQICTRCPGTTPPPGPTTFVGGKKKK